MPRLVHPTMANTTRIRDATGKFASSKQKVGRCCDVCETTETCQWRTGSDYLNLCNACGIAERRRIKAEAEKEPHAITRSNSSTTRTRSTLGKSDRSRNKTSTSAVIPTNPSQGTARGLGSSTNVNSTSGLSQRRISGSSATANSSSSVVNRFCTRSKRVIPGPRFEHMVQTPITLSTVGQLLSPSNETVPEAVRRDRARKKCSVAMLLNPSQN